MDVIALVVGGVIALAGIAGTLLAPLFAERMRRKSVRDEHLLTQRLDVYSDLVRVATRFTDNLSMWSGMPLAQLKEDDDEELNRIVARARVVASDEVKKLLGDLLSCASDFHSRMVMEVQPYHLKLSGDAWVDDGTAIAQRLELAKIADRARETYFRIERAVRKDWE